MKAIFYLTVMAPLAIFSQNSSFEAMLQDLLSFTVPLQKVESVQKNNNTIFIDARSTKEYETSHIENSIFIDYDSFTEKEIESLNLNKNTPIIVYCTVGYRSEKIAETFIKNGFLNVKNLYGGIIEWSNCGKELVNSQNKKTTNTHVYSKEWGQWLLKGEKVYEQ